MVINWVTSLSEYLGWKQGIGTLAFLFQKAHRLHCDLHFLYRSCEVFFGFSG